MRFLSFLDSFGFGVQSAHTVTGFLIFFCSFLWGLTWEGGWEGRVYRIGSMGKRMKGEEWGGIQEGGLKMANSFFSLVHKTQTEYTVYSRAK